MIQLLECNKTKSGDIYVKRNYGTNCRNSGNNYYCNYSKFCIKKNSKRFKHQKIYGNGVE